MLGNRHIFFFLSLALATAGCVGSPDAVHSGSALFEIDPNTRPLPVLATDAWREAPAGCEGRLAGEVTFKVASAIDGLVAAVDDHGDIVCVDTVDAVQEELEESGEVERADELGDQFLLAAGIYLPDMDGIAAADPTPQPSVDGIDGQDPSPQPSMQPRR